MSKFALQWKNEPTLGYTVSGGILLTPMKRSTENQYSTINQLSASPLVEELLNGKFVQGLRRNTLTESLVRIQDLLMDLEDIERVRGDLKFRGAQGTTGVSNFIPTPQLNFYASSRRRN